MPRTQILRCMSIDLLASAIDELGTEWDIKAAYFGSSGHHAIMQKSAAPKPRAKKKAPEKADGEKDNKGGSASSTTTPADPAAKPVRAVRGKPAAEGSGKGGNKGAVPCLS